MATIRTIASQIRLGLLYILVGDQNCHSPTASLFGVLLHMTISGLLLFTAIHSGSHPDGYFWIILAYAGGVVSTMMYQNDQLRVCMMVNTCAMAWLWSLLLA